MKKTLRNLLGIGAVALSLLGSCDFSVSDGKIRDSATITYMVEGKNKTSSASKIIYGVIDNQRNWIDYHTITGHIPVPWSSRAEKEATCHWIRLEATAADASEELTLKIKDKGLITASKEIVGSGNLEYYVTDWIEE